MSAEENTMTTKKTETHITIPEPNLPVAAFRIRGTAPYVQHKFSAKVKHGMLEKQQAGSTGRSKKTTKKRDVEQDYIDAQHFDSDGNNGMPAAAFRSAMISACRLVGFQMTKAKLSVFIEADAYDADEGSPLVTIIGAPEMHTSAVRLATGVASVAVRPMWREWEAVLRVRWDADQFTQTDVANLLMRAGMQVGIGEGRPDSKSSHGMGWGTFEIVSE